MVSWKSFIYRVITCLPHEAILNTNFFQEDEGAGIKGLGREMREMLFELYHNH